MIDEYLRKYNDFVVTLHQTSVITHLSLVTLKDFPHNLPEKISIPYNGILDYLSEQIAMAEKGIDKFSLKINFEEPVAEIKPFIILVLMHVQANKNQPIDFQKAITAQHLIMIFAHLDAFMADSMRVMCQTQPRIMASQKKYNWENIIEAGNWNTLINNLIDEFVSDFGQPNTVSRIERLKTQFGLEIRADQNEINLLDEAENLRHSFVHNGGRVDSTLIKRLGNNNLVIGAEIQLSKDYLDAVFRAAVNLGASIFENVAKKFLKIDLEKNPLPIWTTGIGDE